MGWDIGVHGTNHRQIIDQFPYLRENVADLDSTFSLLCKFER